MKRKTNIVQSGNNPHIPNDADVEKVLSEMPADKRAIITQAIVEQHYSGPIPSASEFARYKECLPDAPNRILTMAEEQQIHRNEMERQIISERIRENKKGQLYGFIVVVLFLIGAIYVAYIGNSSVAIAVISAATVLACIFVLKVWPKKMK